MRPQIKSVIYFTGEFLPNFDLKIYDFKLEKTLANLVLVPVNSQ
jgi:hypothetical protein